MSYPNTVHKFVSNPVEIEAMQYTDEGINTAALAEWIRDNGGRVHPHARLPEVRSPLQNKQLQAPKAAFLTIYTLEGPMRADVGDWIIRGTRGEFYPCKPDVFAVKYRQLDIES